MLNWAHHQDMFGCEEFMQRFWLRTFVFRNNFISTVFHQKVFFLRSSFFPALHSNRFDFRYFNWQNIPVLSEEFASSFINESSQQVIGLGTPHFCSKTDLNWQLLSLTLLNFLLAFCSWRNTSPSWWNADLQLSRATLFISFCRVFGAFILTVSPTLVVRGFVFSGSHFCVSIFSRSLLVEKRQTLRTLCPSQPDSIKFRVFRARCTAETKLSHLLFFLSSDRFVCRSYYVHVLKGPCASPLFTLIAVWGPRRRWNDVYLYHFIPHWLSRVFFAPRQRRIIGSWLWRSWRFSTTCRRRTRATRSSRSWTARAPTFWGGADHTRLCTHTRTHTHTYIAKPKDAHRVITWTTLICSRTLPATQENHQRTQLKSWLFIIHENKNAVEPNQTDSNQKSCVAWSRQHATGKAHLND